MHNFGSADSNGHRKAASMFASVILEQFGESKSKFFVLIQLKHPNLLKPFLVDVDLSHKDQGFLFMISENETN